MINDSLPTVNGHRETEGHRGYGEYVAAKKSGVAKLTKVTILLSKTNCIS